MKCIFPCSGSIILNKSDIEKLNNEYKKVENNISGFSYLNNVNTIVLNDATIVTPQKIKEALRINSQQVDSKPDNTPIDDSSIYTNPFFTTLKYLN